MNTDTNIGYVYALYDNEHNVYIGATQNQLRRYKEHYRDLLAKKHTNYKLQDLYNQGHIFYFTILKTCSKAKLSSEEIGMIKVLSNLPVINVLNIDKRNHKKFR